MTVHPWPRFLIVLGLALILVLACPPVSFGQTSPDKTDLLVLQQTLDELAIALPAQIKKIDDPTVRVFLKLRIASVLWNERQQNTIAESLTVAALDEIDANDAIPSLHA